MFVSYFHFFKFWIEVDWCKARRSFTSYRMYRSDRACIANRRQSNDASGIHGQSIFFQCFFYVLQSLIKPLLMENWAFLQLSASHILVCSPQELFISCTVFKRSRSAEWVRKNAPAQCNSDIKPWHNWSYIHTKTLKVTKRGKGMARQFIFLASSCWDFVLDCKLAW